LPLCGWGICNGPRGSIRSKGLRSHITAAAIAPAHSGRPQESPQGPGSLWVSLFRGPTFRVGYLLWPAGLDSKQGAKKSCHSSRHCSSALRSTSGEAPAAWQPLQDSGVPFLALPLCGWGVCYGPWGSIRSEDKEVMSQQQKLGSLCDFWTSGADSAQPGPRCMCATQFYSIAAALLLDDKL
jgi:hypothetical protein